MLIKLLFLSLVFLTPALALPFDVPATQALQRVRGAIITTTQGKIFLRLFPDKAPMHVANLKYLADQDFYDNMRFNIFEKNYLIQTGAPAKNSASGPPYTIPPEFNEHKHVRGALSMVRKPDHLDLKHTRNSHGSQFRILIVDSPHMDGQFTVFGQVVAGFDVLDNLEADDYIKDLTVYVKR